MKHVGIVGIQGIPAMYGGFETFVQQWLSRRNGTKITYTVYCELKYKKIASVSEVKRVFLPFRANGIQSLLYDATGILHSCLTGKDTIVLLGVSGAWIIPLLKIFTPNKKFMVNIDGIEWKRAKWSKSAKSLLRWLEQIAVRNCQVVVVDNGELAGYVRETYGINPITIPYGHEHLNKMISKRRYDYILEKALTICRVEPENNCELLLAAVSKTPSLSYTFVGNWDASEYGKRLHKNYSAYDNISLVDATYDVEYLNQLRSKSDVYLHGHTVGGTNPSLIEAMTMGVPIICFDNGYNRWTTDNRAGYFHDEVSLKQLLTKRNTNYFVEWQHILDSKFSWEKVIKLYEEHL